MSFTWSLNAPHIQRLFQPWIPGNGCLETEVAAAESALAIRLPSLLRQFYLDWGKRDDLTRAVQHMLSPHELRFHNDGLIVCAENQGVWCWAIRREHLSIDDPPVSYAYNEPGEAWHVSHAHFSHFLDYLTYQHALAGAARHGAYAHERVSDDRLKLLRQHCRQLVLPSYPAGIKPDAGYGTWELLLGEDYVIDTTMWIAIAARREDDLDQIRRLLAITWERVW